MENIKCRIKVIVNPTSQSAFSIRTSPETKIINIKMMVKTTDGVHSLLSHVQSVLDPKYRWDIEWNWKNTPDPVKKDAEFIRKIHTMFSSAPIIPVVRDISRTESPKRQHNSKLNGSREEIDEPPTSSDLESLITDTKNLRVGKKQFPPTYISSVSPKASPPPRVYSSPIKQIVTVSGYNEIDVMASQALSHMLIYKQYPDMHGLDVSAPRKKDKAVNYIKTILGRQDLSYEDALAVAKTVAIKLASQT